MDTRMILERASQGLDRVGQGLHAAKDLALSSANWVGRSVVDLGRATLQVTKKVASSVEPFFTEKVKPFVTTNSLKAKDAITANPLGAALLLAGVAISAFLLSLYRKNNQPAEISSAQKA